MPKLMNLVGQTFNDLTVIERAPSQKKQTMWLCQCSCGSCTVVSSGNLRHGSVKSCGCKQFSAIAEKLTKNEVGNRFGRLVALEQIKKPIIRNGKKDGNYVKYRCLCDCGKETVVWGAHLRRGDIVSCGCFRNETLKTVAITHGLSGTKEYNRYKAGKYNEMKKLHDTEWTLEMERSLRSLFPCCAVCGITEEEHKEQFGQSLHVDHVLPLSKGHSLQPGNAVVLCRGCNSSKLNHDLSDLPLDWQFKILWNAERFNYLWSGEIDDVIMTNYRE